jgi:Ni,Fe-hydrogenase III component G
MAVDVESELKTENTIKESLAAKFGDKINVNITRRHRMFVDVARDDLVSVVNFLYNNHEIMHTSTISAVDVGRDIEILYHLFGKEVAVTVRTRTPKDNPEVDTITSIMPGALFYEREIQDLLGVKVRNIPDGRRLVLPEEWPEGVYPLRKDFEVKWTDLGKTPPEHPKLIKKEEKG